ncbi:DUF4168 domain-containing protein [Leptolyngbya sp. FACHB-261]|uniref:DUF4168 domain-containing protein n=1 Tax=Leptolyngbya sp. FACHB-261 TaxID=2692806 RepID=UPI0016839ABC|nr:DUF4168 domain-containing protein [Leptolyngbya sp. FACHB-261]MBD2104801.1 DUF4168 domain-containing protein [Leptolyngbya sp. FACHB-261]
MTTSRLPLRLGQRLLPFAANWVISSMAFSALILATPFAAIVQAQTTFSDDQIQRFARAYIKIEALQARLQSEAQNVEGMPQLMAQAQTQARTQPNFSLCRNMVNDLPPQGATLCQTLRTETTAILRENGVDVDVFNEIVQRYPSETSLKERVNRAVSAARGSASR